MKDSQPMVSQQGQISQEIHHPQPPTIHQLQQQKSLIYQITQWNHKQQNTLRLLELQVVITAQLPELPTEYIHKIISNKNYISLLVILNDKVIGGTTFRLFCQKSLAELVFFAIEKEYQGIGFGKRLMHIFKEFLNTKSIKYILTYADDTARMFFKKMGFSKDITLSPSIWQGLIEEYSGSKLMQCKLSSSINYIIANQFIQKQKVYINQQIKKVCLIEVIPKQKIISAIKQKKNFIDSLPNISLRQLIRKLPCLDKYEDRSKESRLNLSNSRVSIQEECKDLMYEILALSQTSNFHLDKYFYEKVPDSQNQLNGVNFPTIFRKIENEEYSNLNQFIQDLNSFILLIKDQYKSGEKKESAIKLAKFLESKMENLRYLQQVLSAKLPQPTSIQQEKPVLQSQ